MRKKLGKSVSCRIRKTKSMSTNPLVSIIIPVYNVEKFLPQCLDSVVNQTYNNIEVILINDGSPDGSDAICQDYANQYNKINYIKRENAGASATRNYGIGIAKGDYIFFLDSDDYLKEDCIAIMVDAAKAGQLVATGYLIDDEYSRTVFAPQQNSGSYDSIKSYLLDFHKYFATKFNFSWGKVFRKDIIDQYNIRFPEDCALSEDVLFNIAYYKHCDKGVLLLEDKGYYYRQSDSSTLSKKFNPKMFEWNERAYSTIRDYLVENGVMTNQNRTHFYSNVLGNLLYSTELLCLQSHVGRSEKLKLIRTYSNTIIAKEAYQFSSPSSKRSHLMKVLLKHRMVNTYIFANQLIKTIKNLLR